MEQEENVTRYSYEGKELILIAAAHVSKKSAALVREVALAEQPDSICIELDEDRYRSLLDPDAWKKTDVIQVIKQKKVGFLIASLFLSAYQKKIAKNLGTTVGQEMQQGIDCAKEFDKNLVLADRKLQTTFLRIWRKLGFFEKIKLLFSLVFAAASDEDETELTEADLENLLQTDMLEGALSEVREQFPKIGEILVDERDSYLAYHIKTAPGPKVLAVLGGAHVPGILRELDKDEQDIAALDVVPPPGKLTKILGWVIPAIIVALIVYGFAQGFQTGMRQIGTWVIWNSSLAALFTAFALAHPLSILTSLVLAPFTSINPLLACGWFAGLAEATLRKPTVADVEQVPEDIFSLRGFFRNRFLRILLVVIMANIGSSIGTFVAGADIVSNLF
jgi:pheromone shutdown-related protein TraB